MTAERNLTRWSCPIGEDQLGRLRDLSREWGSRWLHDTKAIDRHPPVQWRTTLSCIPVNKLTLSTRPGTDFDVTAGPSRHSLHHTFFGIDFPMGANKVDNGQRFIFGDNGRPPEPARRSLGSPRRGARRTLSRHRQHPLPIVPIEEGGQDDPHQCVDAGSRPEGNFLRARGESSGVLIGSFSSSSHPLHDPRADDRGG